ncbi:hypothetical protein [Kangiella sp.]|uniref:tetratricopeptide repeat protein n=1 Tax=Kangiella sp. TaxID=1920245 RepID=UPI0019C330C3|nr:hypothetical protein [Kangiella sp.]MBD3654160.1 sel1 repeat family protein [Kangiella sp.]
MKNVLYLAIALVALVSSLAVKAVNYSQYVAQLLRDNGYEGYVHEYQQAVSGGAESRLEFSETLRLFSTNGKALWGKHEHLDYGYWLTKVPEDELVEWAVEQGFRWVSCDPSDGLFGSCNLDHGEYFFKIAAKADDNAGKVGMGVVTWMRGSDNKIRRNEATEWWEDAYKNGADYSLLERIFGLWWGKAGELPGAEAEAMKWLQRAQERGSPHAEFSIAYLRATTPTLKMKDQGIKDLKRLANAKNAEAAYRLGLIYDNGVNTEVDHEEAMKWFQKGWDLGHYNSFLNAVIKLMDGSEEDQKRAFKAFQPYQYKDTYPSFYMGVMYRDGIGTEVDLEKALYQFRIAERLKHPEAAAQIKELEKRIGKE